MRYQKIESRIWNDEKFITLTPNQQRLFFYILTSPHCNICGIYVLKSGYACEDLKSLPKDFEKDLRKLIEKDLIKYDEKVSVVWIKNFLKHNPITNPNQKIAVIKILKSIPKTALVLNLKGLIKGLPEGLWEGLQEGLREGLLKPETETEAETEEYKRHKKFAPPTLLEIQTYVIEYIKQKSLEGKVNALKFAETFLNKNISIGWKVGRNQTPMKDWKAAIRVWIGNIDQEKLKSGKYTRSPESDPELSKEDKIKLLQERLLKLKELDALDEIRTCEAQLKKLQEGNDG